MMNMANGWKIKMPRSIHRCQREARERNPAWIICVTCEGWGVIWNDRYYTDCVTNYFCPNCDGEGGYYDDANV